MLVWSCCHLAGWERSKELLWHLYPLEGDAEEGTGRDGVDLASAALALAGPDEPVRVVDIAPLDAQHLQGAREQAEVAEVLRRVEENVNLNSSILRYSSTFGEGNSLKSTFEMLHIRRSTMPKTPNKLYPGPIVDPHM